MFILSGTGTNMIQMSVCVENLQFLRSTASYFVSSKPVFKPAAPHMNNRLH